MEQKETKEIKESLFKLPELVKKIEAYFNTETPKETPKVDEKKEQPKETSVTEQDFSAVISVIEKSFTKAADFETFKASLIESSTKVTETFTALTAKNEALEAKFTAQDTVIKEIFDLVKKIGDTPSEESQFKKKDGAKGEVKFGNMASWMKEAAELTKKNFK